MTRITQVDKNPFPNSDSNKRYYTYDYYLKRTFGSKVAKITLDAGFTCPNIDGKCSVGGCIYCSGRGSGDFAGNPLDSVTSQLDEGIARMSSKWKTDKIIPYFQAHTNTYADVLTLKKYFEPVLGQENVVGISIATRADALPEDVLDYLADLNKRTFLIVELGLQSIFDETGERINRCHTYEEFLGGYEALKERGIKVCVHLIDGLPGETKEMMVESAKAVAKLRPEFVKLHLLHILKDTVMAGEYEKGEIIPLTLEEYVDIIISQLEYFSPETVIQRITGDGGRDTLIAPLWSLKKFVVLNEIDKEMIRRNTYQGVKSDGA